MSDFTCPAQVTELVEALERRIAADTIPREAAGDVVPSVPGSGEPPD